MKMSATTPFPVSKYQVPAKLFKRLGTEANEPPPPSPSSRAASIMLLSPRALLTKSRGKSVVLSSIPRLIRESVDYLRDDDRDKTEGLFRIPGNSENVDKLILMYDSKEFANEEILQLFKPPPHDVATLMKRYLMKLAHPLIDVGTKRDMLAIVAKGNAEDKDKQLIAYEVVVRALEIDEVDRCALAYILRFLFMVSSADDANDGSSNRMTVENLARMFAPIIMRDDEGDVTDARKQIENAIIVTEILIWNAMELITRGS